MDKLVSIIIPCYNGEKTIARCLDSILLQDYASIEVIVVNDGSTDNSVKIIQEYIPKFNESGMNLLLIDQENKGLAGAINSGLAIFSGEYLCWIDCDDFLLKQSISKRVNFLQANLEVAVVTSDAYYYDESDLCNPMRKASEGIDDLFNPYQFENLLCSKAIFCCGCHMVRAEAFFDVIPNRKIYPARRGQNWQILLPLYYKYKHAFLDEPLYAYIVYKSSMSSGDISKEQYKTRYSEHRDIVINTLRSMCISKGERRKYILTYERIYYRQLFYLSISFKDIYLLLASTVKMIKYRELNIKDIIWLLDLLKNIFRKKVHK